MSTTTPVVYIVYKLKFWQGDSPAHVAIGLVREDQEDQGTGLYYQVTGNPVEGMQFFHRPDYNFGKSRVLMEQTKMFKMPGAFLASFHHIAETNPPPYDPTAPAPLDLRIPTRECAAWVTEVLERARAVIESGIPIA